jgi:hypothetical protein
MNARLSGQWGKLFPNMHIQVCKIVYVYIYMYTTRLQDLDENISLVCGVYLHIAWHALPFLCDPTILDWLHAKQMFSQTHFSHITQINKK